MSLDELDKEMKRLVEIQHGSLAAIRDKVRRLLDDDHRVTVVKPIVARKRLIKRAAKGGEVVDRRFSPKRGRLFDLFDELVHFTRVFPHRRLILEVPLTIRETPDHFDELLARIRDIRASEKRFYQKLRDLFALSADYDKTDKQTQSFFAEVQNKLLYAVTGKGASEIVTDRADASRENMGLTNWRGSKVRKDDIIIAKNYLNEKELLALNNLIEQYLIFAEGQAMQKIPMRMKDWIKKLEGFLTLNNRKILMDKGKISHQEARQLAEKNYKKFNKKRANEYNQIDADFDNMIKFIENKKKKKRKK